MNMALTGPHNQHDPPLATCLDAPASTSSALRQDSADREVVVDVRNVSKAYRLYDQAQDRLKHSLLWRFGRSYGREFWALRNVSFSVRRGEALGIIGRNGSGKSTLLQIIAGVLQPTTGEVWVRGRVGALLELGSGFNPELTGRENIYLSGAILGLSRREMEERVADIAAFADIGDFLDQPVKTYSSGMFVRLAFAVATSTEPDVLLVDEALAVGDVFFRQKCYQRLQCMLEQGTAVLWVSHALTEVEQFCQHALLLHEGDPLYYGPATQTVKRYYLLDQQTSRPQAPPRAPAPSPSHPLPSPRLSHLPFRPACPWPSTDAFLPLDHLPQVTDGSARCTAVAVCNLSGQPTLVFEQGDAALFYVEWELLRPVEAPTAGIVLFNDRGIAVHGKDTLAHGIPSPCALPAGTRLRTVHRIALELAVGEYTFEVGLAMLPLEHYAYYHTYTHSELHACVVRLCHVPNVAALAIVWRTHWTTTQLLHHGIANLPGSANLWVVHPS
jgi:lipopolysaccharide transport system ATP-binding protein